MRSVNPRTVISSAIGLEEDIRSDLFSVWGISPKPEELTGLASFLSKLDELAPNSPDEITRIIDGCYLGFSIPRISKEFDCLWIGENTIVNVELKSRNIGAERMKKQLVNNRYYLGHLKRSINSFTFDSSTGNCYTLDSSEIIISSSVTEIAKALYKVHQEILFNANIEDLFPPEQFLVSPFNSTEAFLKGHYFLTNQQQEIKKRILLFMDDPSAQCFCALTGGPGSGKTLLMYDIAKEIKASGKDVLIGHAGGLNEGQKAMIDEGWKIRPTKSILSFDFSSGDIIEWEDADIYLIDEAQRCYNLDYIIKGVTDKGKKCLLTFDGEQVMSIWEKKRDNNSKIKDLVGDFCFSLTSNIRTNAAVYEFVRALFDLSKSVNKPIGDNVEISYCQNIGEAVTLLLILKSKGFHVPKFTPRLHGVEEYEAWFPSGEQSAHEVIGQEFDYVTGLMSDKMMYDVNGKLISCGNYYYSEDRMLYQILTRARKKIHLVIVNNPIVLKRCLKLIGV